jgi:hypothetical protein
MGVVMKPLLIVKQINKTLDLLQEDIEDCKKNNDVESFKIYLQVLVQMQKALNEARDYVASVGVKYL